MSPTDKPAIAGGQAHVTVPVWLVMSGASHGSIVLYCALKALAGAGGVARIGGTKLARLVGYRRSDRITRYMLELQMLGALTVVRRADKAPGEYRVHDDPPKGHAGPWTPAEWLELAEQADCEAAA